VSAAGREIDRQPEREREKERGPTESETNCKWMEGIYKQRDRKSE
jgi:hypothetical protein